LLLTIVGATSPVCRQIVYVPNNYAAAVSVYVVNPGAGILTEVLSGVPVPGNPTAVAVVPGGNSYNSTNVTGFRIDSGTGRLEQLSGESTGVPGPIGAIVDPSGQYLYVACRGDGNIWAFSINTATGVLTAVAGSPFAADRRAGG
jgi:6-phosphogluconolactonase (cycloisomerase 2 family)